MKRFKLGNAEAIWKPLNKIQNSINSSNRLAPLHHLTQSGPKIDGMLAALRLTSFVSGEVSIREPWRETGVW